MNYLLRVTETKYINPAMIVELNTADTAYRPGGPAKPETCVSIAYNADVEPIRLFGEDADAFRAYLAANTLPAPQAIGDDAAEPLVIDLTVPRSPAVP